MSRGHMREGLKGPAKDSGLNLVGKKRKTGKMLSQVKDTVGIVLWKSGSELGSSRIGFLGWRGLRKDTGCVTDQTGDSQLQNSQQGWVITQQQPDSFTRVYRHDHLNRGNQRFLSGPSSTEAPGRLSSQDSIY